MRTGQVTYAVRSTVIDGMEIHEGDIMALGDSGILAVGKTVPAAAMDAVRAIVDGETELISVYYGSDVSEEDANALLAEDVYKRQVQSRYSIVIATAKRARQLIAGEDAAVAAGGRKPLSTAIDELYQGKVKIVSEEDIAEEEIKMCIRDRPYPSV